MIRKKNKYLRPRKLYEKTRIEEENKLKELYGLKNKKEIWKTDFKVNYFRRRAKALAKSSIEEQTTLFNKLKEIGLNVNSIADVLDLKIRNLLERRLPTIVYRKGLSKTVKEARQMVVHKRISINGNINNTPSYYVRVSEENGIRVKPPVQRVPKLDKAEVKE